MIKKLRTVLKKFLIALCILFSSSLLAEDKTFISAGIVHQNIDDYSNTQALHLNYSYLNSDFWGIDLGYTQSFAKAKHQETKKRRNFSSAYILASYLTPLSTSLAIKSKVGYIRNKSSSDGFGYGIDFILQITQKRGISLGYLKMNENINYFMINNVYKF